MSRESTRRLLAGVALLGVVGCAVDAEPGETTTVCANELSTQQGVSLNGHNLNRIALNGHNLNRISLNGESLNRISLNGVNLNRISLNGHNLNRIALNGQSLNRISLNGHNLNRIALNGHDLSGLPFANGGGLDQDATTPVAFSSERIAGMGLRGVSEADAERWVAGLAEPVRMENLVRLGFAKGALLAQDSQGQALAAEELGGLLLPFSTDAGTLLWVSIATVASHPDKPELPLYSLEIGGENLCEEHAPGFFVPGVWDETGAWHDRLEQNGAVADTTFSCTTGVIAKCVVWGYEPWSVGSQLHQACTRMARADYCGDGVPHTENGTLIDIFDTSGIQTPVIDPALSFEAGWNSAGAVCVNSPRYLVRDASGRSVLPSCWAQKPACADWEAATLEGASIGNESQHLTRKLDCSL